jgi:hypothetical protein
MRYEEGLFESLLPLDTGLNPAGILDFSDALGGGYAAKRERYLLSAEKKFADAPA